jgi:ATP-binding cassette subfamily B protein
MKHKTNHDKHIPRKLWMRIKAYPLLCALTLLCAIVNVGSMIAIPALIGNAIDDITAGADLAGTLHDAILIAGLVAISASTGYLLQIAAYRIAYNTGFSLRRDIERKINRLPLSFLDRTAKGDLINSVSVDTEILSDGLVGGVVQFLSGILTVAGTIVIMFAINYKLALVVILITPLSLLTAKLITGRSKREFAAQSALRGQISAHTSEWIGGLKLVSAFNMQEKSVKHFRDLNENLRKVGFKAQLFSALVNPTTRFVNNLVYIFTGFVGFMLILSEQSGTAAVTVGVLATFLTYASQYTKPFNEISATYAELQNAVSSAGRIFTLLDETEDDNTEIETLDGVDREVKFESLRFSYIKENPVIKDVNFTALAGQHIAVVGPTGCGKTTLINLLLRFYEPDSGFIAADGTNIKKVTKKTLRENISMVLQDSFIFEGTVRDNIRYGSPDADEEAVKEAAKTVGAHGFITRMKDGYDTLISDTGDLSAGQKQLLCIARVMLSKTSKSPPVLILDEATSNIDTVTERKIREAVKKLTEGRTSVIIAHRLNTVRDADLIIVMDKGRVVQTGRHEELIAAEGLYSSIYMK